MSNITNLSGTGKLICFNENSTPDITSDITNFIDANSIGLSLLTAPSGQTCFIAADYGETNFKILSESNANSDEFYYI